MSQNCISLGTNRPLSKALVCYQPELHIVFCLSPLFLLSAFPVPNIFLLLQFQISFCCISPGTTRPLSKSNRIQSTRLQSRELSTPLSLGAISVAIKQAITQELNPTQWHSGSYQTSYYSGSKCHTRTQA